MPSLVPIKLPPGFFRNGTEYEASGRWYDGNLVRWENGTLKPIGGWQALLAPGTVFTGVARGGMAWEDNNGFKYIVIGTNSDLYIGEGGVFTDVTPAFTAVTGAVSGTAGVVRLAVGSTAGFVTGQSIIVAGVGGTTEANGTWLATVVDSTHVELQGTTFVHAYTSGGTVTWIALIAGRVDSIAGAGYGAGPYGAEAYGTQRSTSSLVTDAATWSFDTLGQTALGVLTSDGRLLQFDPSTGLVTVPAGSPTNNLGVMVTNEDFVLMLGAGGQGRKIQWPDVGTTTVWTPLTTNAAGSIQLNTGGRCKAGSRVGQQNIVWTDADVHLINYVGSPGIYGPVRLAEGCGLVGPNAYAVTDIAYWWSWGGFFTYNGIVQPMNCEVQDYIFKNVNWLQAAKIYGEINSQFNEVTWLFPSLNSTENDSYVTYNYKMNCWYFGIGSSLGARTTWVDRGTFPLPMAVDPSGVIYEHETGYLANGVSRVGQVFAQSGPAQIGNGDKILYANLLLPDGVNTASLTMQINTRLAPLGAQTTGTPVSLTPNAEGYVPVRVVGRQAAVRINAVADTDWSIGETRIKAIPGGGR